ncbi:hypothetical protein CASFOL_041168 [Castilleja foliolosa]|uniref:Protein farnesyltransferase/geranylgeranyltransferase type-1 subunit alpha n=1 Tax=Castilleja foliolosa TaxID=1961234 RepID=A0ABD3BDV0_9LAMI
MDSTFKNSLGDVSDDGTSVTKEWYERKCNVEMLGSTEEALFDELKYTAKLLHKDSRNKYAWSHRQWALEKLGRGYADELGLCNQMPKHEHNAHNRLIWDQKFFAVQKCLAKGMTIIRSCEVNVAMHAILDYPEDENPWRYLRLLYKNDMEALARHAHLQWALICIFVESSNSVDALIADKVMYEHDRHARLFYCVNKRGCLFALDLVSDLLKHGYQPDGEAKDTFDKVFQEYDGNTFAEKVDAVLQEHRLELMELCADFTSLITDIAGDEPKIHVSSRRSPPFPRSELCGKAGYSCNPAFFRPEDPNWVTRMRETKLWDDESYFGRRGRRIIQPKVSKDDHKDIYSDLPDSLRISCRLMDKYSESDLMDYTRTFLFSDGHITPTVWHLRRLAIHVRGFSLENEVEVLAILGESSIIDNFLFWHHRRWVSEKIGSDAAANTELEFTAKILSKFPYNHYAWSHRQWVREVLGKDWGIAELDYCNKILKEDASNCFAWSQRYFVVQKHPKRHEMRGNEVKYAIAAIHAEPENEMPWMYLKCLVSRKNYKVLNDSSTFVLSNVVRHIKEGKVDICDACVKKRVVNALKMVLFALKRSNFKPNHDLKTNIDYLSPPEAAEESFAEKVVSILCSMDVSCMQCSKKRHSRRPPRRRLGARRWLGVPFFALGLKFGIRRSGRFKRPGRL